MLAVLIDNAINIVMKIITPKIIYLLDIKIHEKANHICNFGFNVNHY